MTENTSQTRHQILLVEDEPHLAFNLKLNLELENYEVVHAATGEAALDEFQKNPNFDLVLLDVMIPEPNGFEIARTIRRQSSKTAVIFLTARTSDRDRIHGLEIGVDDYISKPFNLKELLLKVRRAMERNRLFGNQKPSLVPSSEEDQKILKIGNYSLDSDALVLIGPTGKIQLTVLEADVLREFITHENQVLSREHLLANVWRVRASMETRTVDNFVMRLRKYLENDPKGSVRIDSIRGRGYCLRVSDTSP